MPIDNFKLRTKLLLPIVISGAAIMAVAGLGSAQLKSSAAEAEQLIRFRDVAVVKVARAARMMAQAEVYTYAELTNDSNSAMGHEAKANFPASVKNAGQLLTEAAALVPDRAATVNGFKDRFATLSGRLEQLFKTGSALPGLENGAALTPDNLAVMAKVAKGLAETGADVEKLVADTVDLNSAIVAENAARSDALQDHSQVALLELLLGGGFAILIAAAFSYWLATRKVSLPLALLSTGMRRLAEGDLGIEVAGQGQRDEIGEMAQAVAVFRQAAIDKFAMEQEAAALRQQAEAERERNERAKTEAGERLAEVVEGIGRGLDQLAQGALSFRLDRSFAQDYEKLRTDFNDAMAKLADTMSVVASNTSAIRSGTGEISTAADDLSRRTEQQAASLEETAAALDEVTATVRKTSQSAIHARDVVGNAKTGAEQSGVVVRRAVEAMTGIERSAREISQIIGVIDEIAFQTNLLALNAGVEAARAGEAGRGFAVVASEVRALAQRSAEAAKEIKGLISTSSRQVEQGVELVDATGKALEQILDQVAELNTIVSEIAASAQEQAAGLDQINTAINQMDQVTQQNAAMVEESTAASHALSRETEELQSLVGRFQLGGLPVAAAPVAVRRAQPRPVAQLRTVGRSGAARQPAPDGEADWQDF